jgi:hypothetical protein
MLAEIYNLTQRLTSLEITLIVVLTLLSISFFYVLKQWLILRYVFFTSSDWCADKIKEISEDATERIVELVRQLYELKNDKNIEHDEAIKYVSTSIVNANKDWFTQKEKFQTRLEKNGQPRLSYDDGWFSLGARWYKN